MTIVSNQIQCAKCNDVIYSASRHDFKKCSCGAVSVDGGMDYLKRGGNREDIIEQSIVLDDDLVKSIIEKADHAHYTGRNPWGIANAVIRAIRDNGYKIVKNTD